MRRYDCKEDLYTSEPTLRSCRECAISSADQHCSWLDQPMLISECLSTLRMFTSLLLLDLTFNAGRTDGGAYRSGRVRFWNIGIWIRSRARGVPYDVV